MSHPSIPTGAISRVWAVLVLGGAFACNSTPAQAIFTAPILASSDPALGLQADFAYDPAISADGTYLAFTGSVASAQGIYRKNTATGQLELVAKGSGAGAASISSDGRYVSFTTDENPVTGEPEQAGAACTSVYVRDMNEPESSPAAFTLASAHNGSSQSLTYQAPSPEQPCGSASATRVALSADGRQVAFTILSASDLTGDCVPAGQSPATSCPTAPNQIAVRDLDTQVTTLVSVTRASIGGTPQPVPGGAALSGPTSSGRISLSGGAQAELAVSASTAAISADASTVGWMGVDIGEQVDLTTPPPTAGHTNGYAEPLWRRISGGAAAPTRRVLEGEDPSAAGCPPVCTGGLDLEWDTQGISSQEYNGSAPEYGSFTSLAGVGFSTGAGFADPIGTVTPQLSADGNTVALLSTQPNYGGDPNFGLLDQTKPPPANAFVVNMSPGLTRTQAIERLTDWASLKFSDAALASPVTSIALSPDGTRVAFTTQRVAFPLAPPALITPPLSQAAAAQLYEANLRAGTLQLVSDGYDGQPANGSVTVAALSENGTRLALASSATNLAYGVVNEGSDVFTTEEQDPPAVTGLQSIGSPPPGPLAAIPWRISATVAPSPDGTLLVYVSVPGAGSLSATATATATSSLPKRSTGRRARSRWASVSSQSSRAVSSKRRSVRHTAHRRAVVSIQQVARAGSRTSGPTIVELHLVPAARYRSLAGSKGGLYVKITVTFSSPGRHRLKQALSARFPRRSPLYDIPEYRLPKPKHAHPHRGRGRRHR